jgi:pimeloyl-ACP methyl ester carboxylesterase
MERRDFEVRTADGRLLRAQVAGPEDGALVLFHHGTPGPREIYAGQLRECAARGLRHVCYSRPGYHGSARHAGRTIADCAADTAAVADALGAERFHNVGYSGGGPHALASAAVGRADGAGEENLEEFAAMEAGDVALEVFLRESHAEMARIETGEDVVGALGDLLADADRACLRGELLDFEVANWAEIGRDDVWGWLDDDKATCERWGFEFSQVSGKVVIWHGADDRMVPLVNAEWLAGQLPAAELRLEPGEGHISVLEKRFGTALDELLAAQS